MDGSSENSIRRHWESLSPSELLHTSDNRPLHVLSPGVPNADAGPDYRGALIRLDGRLYRGDIEVHARDRDWVLHGHNTDTHYNTVVLHVVGHAGGGHCSARTAGGRSVPALILSGVNPSVNVVPSFACPFAVGTTLDDADSTLLRSMLRQLGWERLERRIAALEARLWELLRDAHWTIREAPQGYGLAQPEDAPPRVRWTREELEADDVWDQLLYEGIVEGMGYAKNTKAFRTLAQNLPLRTVRRWISVDPDAGAALLFGAAGLLPSTRSLRDRECRHYVLKLRRIWKRIRRAICFPVMYDADWLFFRLRPVNFPTARLAVLSVLLPRLVRPGMARELISWLREPVLSARERRDRLHQFFACVPDGFWRSHLHFRGTEPGPPIALGAERIDAIVLSTILPAAMLYARLLDDHVLHARARAVMRAMDAPPPNSMTRRVERSILQGRRIIDSALLHQGAIELGKRYCQAGRCAECPPSRPARRDGSNSGC